jgi:hypothetical protein
MLKRGLGLIVCVAVGCGPSGIPKGQDMAMTLDMAPEGFDLSVAGDLGPIDMAIPDDAQRPVLFSQFAADYAKALCLRLAQCGKVDSDPASQAACQETQAFLTGWDQDTEIMKGRMIVNELQCLAAVSAQRCDGSDTGYFSERCFQFLYQPLQANGSACLTSVECANGYCAHVQNDAGNGLQPSGCPGTCVPFKTTSCDQLDSCNLSNAVCISGTCNARGDVGADCSSFPCKVGLYCPTFGTKLCATAAATQTTVGGACDPAQGMSTALPSCAAGLYCKKNAGGTGATCETKIKSGQPCDLTTVDFTGLGAGVNYRNDSPCEDGTVCNQQNGATGTCVPFSAVNQPCGVDPDCKVTLYCDTGSKTCKSKVTDGQGCAGAQQCMAQLPSLPSTCIADNGDAGTFTTCQPWKQFGASCNPGFEDSVCYPAAGTPGTSYCAPGKNGGGACEPKCF